MSAGAETRHSFLERSAHIKVKVCCIGSIAEANLAIEAGAGAIGLVSAMPSGPGAITDEAISVIARAVEGRVPTVLLTSRLDVRGISDQLTHIRPTMLQVVDALGAAHYALLRAAHPDVLLMQVIHVRGPEACDDAMAIAPHVDAILLDSGNPTATVKELGGTGRIHDWTTSRTIRDEVAVPVFLAGGLGPHNVADAIHRVRPFGVDVCSGVRRGGRLDPHSVHAFVSAAHTVSMRDTDACGGASTRRADDDSFIRDPARTLPRPCNVGIPRDQ